MATTRLRGIIALLLATTASSAAVAALYHPAVTADDLGALERVRRKIADPTAFVPSRDIQQSVLVGSSVISPLDVLVVGGRAIGCGVALDAVSRGLRVGLERFLFRHFISLHQAHPRMY